MLRNLTWTEFSQFSQFGFKRIGFYDGAETMKKTAFLGFFLAWSLASKKKYKILGCLNNQYPYFYVCIRVMFEYRTHVRFTLSLPKTSLEYKPHNLKVMPQNFKEMPTDKKM